MLHFLMFCVAVVTSLIVTWIVRRVALRTGLVDKPDARRKLQETAIPLGGGVSVLISTLIALAVMSARTNVWTDPKLLIALVVAPILLCLLGLIDDRVALRGRHKLLGQIAIAALVVAGGLRIDRIGVVGYEIELGLLAIPFTICWILGAINALNLLDGSDGIASTVGIVLLCGLAAMAFFTGHPSESFVAIALVGSLLGFLRFNFPPATMYLGDAGSMVIGLYIGVLALMATVKGPATIALAAPTAICTIPFLDTTMAILRRKLTGRSVYTTDRGHLHHRLSQQAGRAGAILLIGLFCTVTAVAAFVSVVLHNEWLALIGSLTIVAVLITGRIFGHSESEILTRRIMSIGRSLCRLDPPHTRGLHVEQFRFQGKMPWDQLWDGLRAMTEKFDVHSLVLNVNIPSKHEEYHAQLRNEQLQIEPIDRWNLDLPLMIENCLIGRVHVSGRRSSENTCQLISEFVDLLDQLLASLDAEQFAGVRPPKPHAPPSTSELLSTPTEVTT